MGRESLMNAERAAGFALATSDELLGICPAVIVRDGPTPKDVVKPALERAAAKPAVPRPRRLSLFSYFPSWTAAKA